MVLKKRKLKGIPAGRPRIARGFTRDVKQALKVGKKILRTKKRKGGKK